MAMNIPFRIIERDTAVSLHSRCIWVHARTQEVLELTDPALIQECHKQGDKCGPYIFYYGGKAVSQLPMELDARGESHYSKLLHLPQTKTSQILASSLIQSGIKIDYGWELMETEVKEETALDSNGQSSLSTFVETKIRRAVDGSNKRSKENPTFGTLEPADEDEDKKYQYETIRSQYLVAADGGRSVVRHKLEVPFIGRTRPANMIVFDGELEGNVEPAKISWIHTKDNRTVIILPIGENKEPNRYQMVVEKGLLSPEIIEEQKTQTLSLEHFQEILDDSIYPLKAKITKVNWLTYYRVNERRAQEFTHKGRIFLAGDAAHIHSPAGGQGLNNGLYDSYNLAWKMALVLKGLAPASLLASYDEERVPMADEIIKFSADTLDYDFDVDRRLIARIRKRVGLAVMPYLEPLLPPRTHPMSMLTRRYFENSINRSHRTQKTSPTAAGAIGRRAGDAALTPFEAIDAVDCDSDATGSNLEGLGSPQTDLEKTELETSKATTQSTQTKHTIRLHQLMSHPGAFQVLVFTGDLWQDKLSTTGNELQKNMDHHLESWRARWPFSNMDAEKSKAVVAAPGSTHHLFMVHTLTTLSSTPLSSLFVEKRNRGEGKLYTDKKGVLHKLYGAETKIKRGRPESGGAIIVVRPDSFIAYRVKGVGDSAWKDVNEYFESLLV
ncbi:hypothetical protein BGZ83_007604 [Gryganskiella cystojenkinii]|nr:hypothetical protein BGZ83_007604 [Gryganskiella cystojenkinii]